MDDVRFKIGDRVVTTPAAGPLAGMHGKITGSLTDSGWGVTLDKKWDPLQLQAAFLPHELRKEK